MKANKPASQPAPIESGPGRRVLDTRFRDRTFRIWITSRPELQPDDHELGGAEQVRIAILANHHQVTQMLAPMLNNAQPGDALVVVCHTQKAWQAALKYLGAS